MSKNKIFGFTLLVLSILAVSCSKNNTPTVDEEGVIAIRLDTRAGSDGIVKGGEANFSSLAVYIFNKNNGALEYAELIPAYTPGASYSRNIRVTQFDKSVYAVANYASTNNTFTAGGNALTLTESTTMAQLDQLLASSSQFADNSIVMAGKVDVTMTLGSTTPVQANIPVKRLASRVDLYLFKSADLTDEVVELVSVQLCNKVTNSAMPYQTGAMPATPVYVTDTYTPSAQEFLAATPGGFVLEDQLTADAFTSFYTFQNVTGLTQLAADTKNAHLLINVKVNNTPVTYKGHIMTGTKYDLERNGVYRVKAELAEPTDRLFLETAIMPWDVEESSIGFGDPQFTFAPTVNPGEYEFTLTAPSGAIWTASLTNGLHFQFSNDNGAVSQGVARTAPYTIKIAATTTTASSTYFYITVGGKEIEINPVLAYPGTNSRILIQNP